jgi:murein DD-endopeptidase MepM/ murein hydrolase activator NlpD
MSRARAALLALLWLLPAPAWASSAGARHVVRSGETVWSIARQHGTHPSALARINALADEDRIRVGQILTLPPQAPARPRATVRSAAGRRAAAGNAVRNWFGWPSRGVVTSRFGNRGRKHHDGIDIATPVGTPIRAARDGVVRFAGWRGGYGRLVILDHGGGLSTWYGHASTIVSGVGKRVRRGELIARVGTTGQVTGPNLHFEVRQNGRPLDPLMFLRRATP